MSKSASSSLPNAVPNCFFERAPEVDCPNGRILLVSYHFPPGQTAGAMRWQKLSGFAHEMGWGLDVLTVSPDSLSNVDTSRLDELTEGIRLFGVVEREHLMRRFERGILRVIGARKRRSIAATGSASARGPRNRKLRPTSFHRDELKFEPLAWRSWFRTYESWIVHLCEDVWARRAFAVGRQIADPNRHRFVLSCGPPHMSHEAARRIAREAGLPLVVDLRDPWSQVERFLEHMASPFSIRLMRFFERRMMRAASLVVMNTEPARRTLQALYPADRDKIVAVPNGFDDDELPRVDPDPRFLIAYAGSIYLDRTPVALFQAAAKLIGELGLTRDDIAIEFMGPIASLDGESIEAIADRTGLAGFVATHPPGTHRQASAFLASASMLVSLPQDSHLAIPSKIYEYMRYESRFLALAEPQSATAELLANSTADVVSPLDAESLLDVLRDAYQQRARGGRAQPLSADRSFSRRARAEQLFAAVDEHVLKPSG